MQNQEMTSSEKQVLSVDYIMAYLRKVHPHIHPVSYAPYSFTIGSNNDGEGIDDSIVFENSLFFGELQLCINPNNTPLAAEIIEIKYRSYFNTKPFFKRITRIVEVENYINEASSSVELFDSLTITQDSTKYDFYLTFVGFKIDYN